MEGNYCCKPHYFDASALVKLVADDFDELLGRDALRKYYWQHTASVYSTSYCIAETFSAFKRKLARGLITQSRYCEYLHDFRIKILGCNLRQDEMPILSPVVAAETDRLIRTYNLDFIDSFQIVTLRHGRYRVLGPNSRSILITADRALAKAARAEGAKVWECTSEPAPN
jgi:predicted nucleic acid-binding protein